MDAKIDELLAPVKFVIPTRQELLVMFKEQRPSALNDYGELYREEYLKLVVSIMTCRVLEGHDMKDAKIWKDRCLALKEQLKQRDYHYIFPSSARIKLEVIKALQETHREEELMFAWSDYSRVIIATRPSFFMDNPSIKTTITRLLDMGGPVSVKTALLLKNGEKKSKIAGYIRQAFIRKQDEVSQGSDRLLSTDLETIQTKYYVDCQHERYRVCSPLHEGAPSDLCLIERNAEQDENRDEDPEVALEFELKASALSETSYNTRRVSITDIFKKNYPVIVDLLQVRNGVIRFYACLMVRHPQHLKEALAVQSLAVSIGFVAKHNENNKFHFHSVEFRPKLLMALKKCGDYELRHLGDAEGSTPEFLAQAVWKIDKLETWISPGGPKKRLSEIKTTSPNATIGNENEDRVSAIFASHPNVSFLPRTSITSAKEDYIVRLGQNTATVSVRTAAVDNHGSMRGSLTVYKKGERRGQSFGEACDIFCFTNAENCIVMHKHDEPLRSALLSSKTQLTWRKGTLDSFIIKSGDMEKIERLFEQSQQDEESKEDGEFGTITPTGGEKEGEEDDIIQCIGDGEPPKRQRLDREDDFELD